MNGCEQKLSQLIVKINKISPQLADYWQATAIVESLGYTDRIIQQEFGFDDALSLGKYIYDRNFSKFNYKRWICANDYLIISTI
jgi:hypothetical protein